MVSPESTYICPCISVAIGVHHRDVVIVILAKHPSVGPVIYNLHKVW